MDFADIAKYIFVGVIAIYTLITYVGTTTHDKRGLRTVYAVQNIMTFVFHLVAYIVLYLNANDMKYIILYICEFALLFATIVVYDIAYPKASRILVNNMVLLEAIGFVMICRINYDECVRQFVLGCIGTVITFFVPAILKNVRQIRNWGWIFAVAGFVLLAVIFAVGESYNGAVLSVKIGEFSLLPSEFVKILFVLFIASMFNRITNWKTILIVTGIAAAHVLLLVVSRDLGAALIFFVAYLSMLYVATRKVYLLAGGIGAGVLSAFLATKAFDHVQRRISAWRDPWQDVRGSGWQIVQSMFSIAAGGWLGVGLGKGIPKLIPEIERDMAISSISEEMGAIVSICIMLICLNNLILMMSIASRCNTLFYRLVAVGLGATYAIQVILTIGGAINFIPLTGVSLPFISYGGSSLISSLIMFALINGMYTMRKE